MASLFSDTHPDAEAVLLRLSRETPVWRKLQIVSQLNEIAQSLMTQGLRERHPDASEAEIQRRLAELVLGEEAVERVRNAGLQLGEVRLNELFAVLKRVVDTLEQLGTPYLIGGSVASVSYGTERTTLDADIVVDLQPDQVDRFAAALGDEFYADADMIRDALERRASFNLIHYGTSLKIDVFIPKARAFDQSQLQRRVRRKLLESESETAYFASAEDIVLAKLEWYRQGNEVSHRQWEDILNVLKAQGKLLDMEYLRHWAAELHVSDLLERALDEAK